MQDLSNKYFIRISGSNIWHDVADMFTGVKILKIDGFGEIGDAVNLYNEQWVDSQIEDCYLPSRMVRKNVDLQVTFICGTRYGATDVQRIHDRFVNYISQQQIEIKSTYYHKQATCICKKSYKPTTVKLHRNNNSYIIGTIELHCLKAPTDIYEGKIDDVYVGFANALNSLSDIQSMIGVQNYNINDVPEDISVNNTGTYYLWICTRNDIGGINGATSGGFDIPLDDYPLALDDFICYRSSNKILPHLMTFSIQI